MIITEKKRDEEILKNLKNAESVFIVGCGGCASKCGTGDAKAADLMAAFLNGSGKKVLGSVIVDFACDIRLAKKDLLKNESFIKAQAVVMLSCGAGSQSVEKVTEKTIVPALESKYIGSTERIGVYKQFCSICGTCILAETEGICPKTRCAKGLVNGPCGGFVEGKCEVDSSKDCAWVLIFEKLKKKGKEREFFGSYRDCIEKH